MKKLFTLLVLLATAVTSYAGCDWSKYWMRKANQQQNIYLFQTNIDWDKCVDYNWIVYDYQLKRIDTVEDLSGFAQIQFNVKGKYTVYLKVVNICDNCDTTFKYDVDITVYNKADVTITNRTNSCKSYTFEMTQMDTCIEYYYAIYKSSLFEELGTYWDTAKDIYVFLYKNYDFDDKDLVYWNMESQRVVNHSFVDSGRHLMYCYWYNKCTGIDTFVMRKVNVCVRSNSARVTTLNKQEPKLIGVYDMMGRPVHNIKENELYIYLYDNNTFKKLIK